ncbi:MAG: cell division protein FtsQ/DivIB [Paracoccaceae bacterium]
MLPVKKYPDPAPSRLRYRFERLWLKRSVRQFVQVWIPAAVVGSVIWVASADQDVRNGFHNITTGLREMVASRPELRVTKVAFPNASGAVQAQILAVTNLSLPLSALDLDVVHLKDAIERLDAIETAEVQVLSDGTLEIRAVERKPTLVWRDGDTLRLIDRHANRVAEIARRSVRGDLPLIVGQSADLAIAEALALVAAAAPIAARVRGLVRVGERRWDVVLDRGQTIMLPAAGAVTALRRVIALHDTEDVLNRDIIIIDMRDVDRPVLRLSDTAIAELRRLRTLVRGKDA